MNLLKLAYRPLFRKGELTTTRIISLAAGLAFGLLLLAEVFYYHSYDSFYPDSKRIYVVHENFRLDKSTDELMSYPRVSGAIAPGLKAEVPGIEASTGALGHGYPFSVERLVRGNSPQTPLA